MLFERGIPGDGPDLSVPRELDPAGSVLGPGRRTWEDSQQTGEEEERHRWWLPLGCGAQANFLLGC